MFLTLDDYRGVCDEYELKQITQNEETRLTAEAAAMEQIGSYLRYRYDMARVFASEGSDRNAMLVQCAVNISLWGKRLHFFFLPARKKTKTADSLLTTRNLTVTVVLTLRA